jgi:hypothetical protein
VTNVKTPCPGCAFRRDITPGALGGGTPEQFIGQAHGPFQIPCHAHYGERSYSEVHAECEEIPQCAGAAIYRANVGVAEALPAQLHKLPADKENVFATPAEFIAHHHQVPDVKWVEIAMEQSGMTVERMVRIEMRKPEVRHMRKDEEMLS